jgi:hypothetical protein
MSDGNFTEECEAAFQQLFDAVSAARGSETTDSCLRHLFDMRDFQAEGQVFSKCECYLLPRCLNNSTNLATFIRACEARATPAERLFLTLLKLQGYVAAIEVKYTYKVIGNLLGELGGGEVRGDLYDVFPFDSIKKRFRDVAARAKQIEACTGRTMRVVSLMEGFLDFDLRNAIGHSDYYVLADSERVIIPGYVVEAMTRGGRGAGKKPGYSFQELDELYSKAIAFNEAFKVILIRHGVNVGPRY